MNARRRRLKFTSRLTDSRNAAVARLARVVNRLSPSTQFVVGFLILVIFTTLLLSRSRSQMPADYREGEIVSASVIAPTDIQIEDPAATATARAQNPAAPPVLMQLRRNQIVAR